VSLSGFVVVRLLSGESFELLGAVSASTFSWSVAYFAAAWVSGGAILALLGFHVRKERRLA
jgi:hypothetical protein